MKRVKRKGGEILILDNGEECPPNEICFLAGEWEFAKGIASGLSQDPEGLKVFWTSLFEKKLTIPGYLTFMDFPRTIDEAVELGCQVTLNEEQISDKAKLSKHYAGEILNMLRGKRNVEGDKT